MAMTNKYYKRIILEDEWPQWWRDIYIDYCNASNLLKKYDATYYFEDENVNEQPFIPIIIFTTKEGYVKFCLERM